MNKNTQYIAFRVGFPRGKQQARVHRRARGSDSLEISGSGPRSALHVLEMWTFVLFVFAFFAIGAEDPVTPTESAVMEARRSITSCEVRMNTTFDFPRMGPPQVWESHLWLSHDHAREDRYVISEAAPPAAPPREIRCSTNSELIYWKSDDASGQSGIAIHRWMGDELQRQRENDPLRFARDPRLAGLSLMNSGALTVATSWENVCAISQPDRHDQMVVENGDDGPGVVAISYTMSPGVDVSILLDRSMGMQPVRITATHDESGVTSCVETKYTWHSASGQWLPSRVVSQQINGGALEWREESSIEFVSINRDIGTETFTIAGLNIPERSIENYPDGRKDTYWDGAEEKPGRRPGRGLTSPPTAAESRSRGWGRVFVLANLFFVLLASVYFSLRIRK